MDKDVVKDVIQLCPTLCDPMAYTVPGILQARILGWVAFPFSRGSSQTRDQTEVSRIAGGFFTTGATRVPSLTESLSHVKHYNTMDCNIPGFLVLHCLPEFAQTPAH